MYFKFIFFGSFKNTDDNVFLIKDIAVPLDALYKILQIVLKM